MILTTAIDFGNRTGTASLKGNDINLEYRIVEHKNGDDLGYATFYYIFRGVEQRKFVVGAFNDAAEYLLSEVVQDALAALSVKS